MSGKNCISKTNEQIFGSIGRFLVGAATTSKGQRTTLFVIGVLCLVGVEMFLIVISIHSVVDFRMGVSQLFPLFGIATIGTAIVCTTIVYAATLYDNCTSNNKESE